MRSVISTIIRLCRSKDVHSVNRCLDDIAAIGGKCDRVYVGRNIGQTSLSISVTLLWLGLLRHLAVFWYSGDCHLRHLVLHYDAVDDVVSHCAYSEETIEKAYQQEEKENGSRAT